MVRIFGQFGDIMGRGTWDMGLEYQDTYNTLYKEFKQIKNKKPLKKYDKIRYTYLIIYLTQLRNGLRIGEAIETILKIKNKFQRKLWVRVEKRKDEEERLVIIPEEINEVDILTVKRILDKLEKDYKEDRKKVVSRLSTYAKTAFKFNTHSLRYSFISYMGKENLPAQIIAKITRHANINHITRYTQEKLAEEALLNIAKRRDIHDWNKILKNPNMGRNK